VNIFLIKKHNIMKKTISFIFLIIGFTTFMQGQFCEVTTNFLGGNRVSIDCGNLLCTPPDQCYGIVLREEPEAIDFDCGCFVQEPILGCCILNVVGDNKICVENVDELSCLAADGLFFKNGKCILLEDGTFICDQDDEDDDNDLIFDNDDNCSSVVNPNQLDTDDDGIGDLCDNCPDIPNSNQLDINLNGIGDVCDPCHINVGYFKCE